MRHHASETILHPRAGGLTLGGPIQKDKTFFFSVTNSRAARKPDSRRSARTISGCSIRPQYLPPFLPPAHAARCLRIGGARATSVRHNRPAMLGITYVYAAAASSSRRFSATRGFPGATFPQHRRATACFVPGLGIHHRELSHLRKGQHLFAAPRPHLECTNNTIFVRGMISPDSVDGIQVNAQNQTFGQNAGNRTSTQQTHDWAIIAQHSTTIAAPYSMSSISSLHDAVFFMDFRIFRR